MRTLVRVAVLACLLLPASCWVGSPMETQPTGKILKFGVYRPVGKEQRTNLPSTSAGYATYGNAKLLSATSTVSMVKGVTFGYDFRLEGLSTGQDVAISYLVAHPKISKPDGSVREKELVHQRIRSVNGVFEGKLWYTLSQDFELVPGEWTLAILYGNTMLIQKKFNVISSNTDLQATK